MNKRKRKQFFHSLGRFSRASAQVTFNRTAQLLRALLSGGRAGLYPVQQPTCGPRWSGASSTTNPAELVAYPQRKSGRRGAKNPNNIRGYRVIQFDLHPSARTLPTGFSSFPPHLSDAANPNKFTVFPFESMG